MLAVYSRIRATSTLDVTTCHDVGVRGALVPMTVDLCAAPIFTMYKEMWL